MGELVVARWQKYGKDRLYVTAVDGIKVGWVDLVTGARCVDQPSLDDAFTIAVTQFCAAHHLPLPVQPDIATVPIAVPPTRPFVDKPGPVDLPSARTSPEAVAPSPTTASPPLAAEPDWIDLALNVPGQAARERAELELAAARDRSRVGTFIARALDVKTDERSWRVGAGGEETVGARLEKLRRHGWQVLHAVPVGRRGSDIDHVVIGPGGVWTLNTKTHPGARVWVGRHGVHVNGHKTDYVRNSRHEAERATRLLTAACEFPVSVKGALVFLTGTLVPDVTIKELPDGVAILDRMDIPRAFRRTARRLSEDEVAGIFAQARRSTTWTT
jgi:hypothetical protein